MPADKLKLITQKKFDSMCARNCKNFDNIDFTNSGIVFPQFAEFSDASFKNCKMENMVFYFASFKNVDFSKTSFANSSLRGCSFTNSNMTLAHINYTNNVACNFFNVVCTQADFSYSNFFSTQFYDIDIRHANFAYVNFGASHVEFAKMENACWDNTNFSNTTIMYSSPVPHVSMRCPSSGAFIAWKKARRSCSDKYCIIKLLVPEDAKRSSAFGSKCRCNKAKVLAIESLRGKPMKCKTCVSWWNNDFKYEVGKTVAVDGFDTNRWVECSNGIHFFIDREDAVNYQFV